MARFKFAPESVTLRQPHILMPTFPCFRLYGIRPSLRAGLLVTSLFCTALIGRASHLLMYSAPGGPMEYNELGAVWTDHGWMTEVGITFEVPEAIRIQKIQAWMNGGGGSTATFSVGLVLDSIDELATHYSQTFPVERVMNAPAKWQGLNSLKWDLHPGTYKFFMSAPDVPLGYGYQGPIPTVDSLINVIDYQDYSQPGNIPWAPFGLEVYGTPLSAVPEPSFYGLMGSAGLLALAATRRLRRKARRT